MFIEKNIMDHSLWVHDVIESREVKLRRYFQGKDVARLTPREDAIAVSNNQYYTRRSHDLLAADRGYVSFFDVIHERYNLLILYICLNWHF